MELDVRQEVSDSGSASSKSAEEESPAQCVGDYHYIVTNLPEDETHPRLFQVIADPESSSFECRKEANVAVLQRLLSQQDTSHIVAKTYFTALGTNLGSKLGLLEFKAFIRDLGLIDLGVSLSAIGVLFFNVTKPGNTMDITSFSLGLYFISEMVRSASDEGGVEEVFAIFVEKFLIPYCRRFLPEWFDPEVCWMKRTLGIDRLVYEYEERLHDIFEILCRSELERKAASAVAKFRSQSVETVAMPVNGESYYSETIALSSVVRFFDTLRLGRLTSAIVAHAVKASAALSVNFTDATDATSGGEGDSIENLSVDFTTFVDLCVRISLALFLPAASSAPLTEMRRTASLTSGLARACSKIGTFRGSRPAASSIVAATATEADCFRRLLQDYVAPFYARETKFKMKPRPIASSDGFPGGFLPIPFPRTLRLESSNSRAISRHPTNLILSADGGRVVLVGSRFDRYRGLWAEFRGLDGAVKRFQSTEVRSTCAAAFDFPSFQGILPLSLTESEAEGIRDGAKAPCFPRRHTMVCTEDVSGVFHVFPIACFCVRVGYSNDCRQWCVGHVNPGELQQNPFCVEYECKLPHAKVPREVLALFRRWFDAAVVEGTNGVCEHAWQSLCTKTLRPWKTFHGTPAPLSPHDCHAVFTHFAALPDGEWCATSKARDSLGALSFPSLVAAVLELLVNYVGPPTVPSPSLSDQNPRLNQSWWWTSILSLRTGSPASPRADPSPRVLATAPLATRRIALPTAKSATENMLFDLYFTNWFAGTISSIPGILRFAEDQPELFTARHVIRPVAVHHQHLSFTESVPLGTPLDPDVSNCESILRNELQMSLPFAVTLRRLVARGFHAVAAAPPSVAVNAHANPKRLRLTTTARSPAFFRAWKISHNDGSENLGVIVDVPGPLTTLGWVPDDGTLCSSVASMTLYTVAAESEKFAAIAEVFLREVTIPGLFDGLAMLGLFVSALFQFASGEEYSPSKRTCEAASSDLPPSDCSCKKRAADRAPSRASQGSAFASPRKSLLQIARGLLSERQLASNVPGTLDGTLRVLFECD